MRMCSLLKRHWKNSIIISIKMHSANDSKFGLLFPFSFGNPNIFWWVSSPTWLFIWHLARHYFVPWLNLISIISIENKQAQVSTQDNKIRSLNETTHGYWAQEVLQFRPKLQYPPQGSCLISCQRVRLFSDFLLLCSVRLSLYLQSGVKWFLLYAQ